MAGRWAQKKWAQMSAEEKEVRIRRGRFTLASFFLFGFVAMGFSFYFSSPLPIFALMVWGALTYLWAWHLPPR
jgi:hypothetical protein